MDPSSALVFATVGGVVFWLIAVAVASFAGPPREQSPQVIIPERCRAYQRTLTAAAHDRFGLSAPVSTLAAQIHQESLCREFAESPVGAQGLAQFMPSTARWMAEIYPRELGPADPLNWRWAIQAQVLYMARLNAAAPGATECDTWAFGLSSYNGGAGWLARDRALCGRTAGCDRARWFGHVALTADPRRAPRNVRENRGYPERILRVLSPAYASQGWGRAVECAGDGGAF